MFRDKIQQKRTKSSYFFSNLLCFYYQQQNHIGKWIFNSSTTKPVQPNLTIPNIEALLQLHKATNFKLKRVKTINPLTRFQKKTTPTIIQSIHSNHKSTTSKNLQHISHLLHLQNNRSTHTHTHTSPSHKNSPISQIHQKGPFLWNKKINIQHNKQPTDQHKAASTHWLPKRKTHFKNKNNNNNYLLSSSWSQRLTLSKVVFLLMS